MQKKKTFGYAERNEQARQEFIKEIELIKPEDLVFSDEAGMDDNDVKTGGWSKKGKRLHATKKSQKTKRISFISALNAKKMFASFIFEGPCTRDVFETYLEKVLVPELKVGQVLVIDNASFHKGGKIKKLIEAAGCRILYLPTYSPDLNPIEHYWFFIKNKIRKFLGLENSDICDAAIEAFTTV